MSTTDSDGDEVRLGVPAERVNVAHWMRRAKDAEAENARLRKALDGADGLLMAAAENLRSADKDERRVEAAFRIASKLDKLRSTLKGGEEGGEALDPNGNTPWGSYNWQG